MFFFLQGYEPDPNIVKQAEQYAKEVCSLFL